MTRRSLLFVLAMLTGALSATVAGGCGNAVQVGGNGGNGTGGSGGYLFLDAGPDGHQPDTGPQKDALPDYQDPGCPDKPPPIENFECDPYHQFNGDCPPGEACFIYVSYPGEPCGQEEYGAVCYLAGPGQQGDPCGGAQDCGAGLVCVITGSGNQCVELCKLDGPSGCPPGLVCEPIDVEGFGGCL